MNAAWKTALRQQFEAALDMLENALRACPDQLWHVRLWDDGSQQAGFSEFWNIAYHTLFWLDLYLSGSAEGFAPPQPFTLDELDPAGELPDRPYSRDELLAYLEHARTKCRWTIDSLTNKKEQELCKFPWGQLTLAGLLLDNLRHVQEHTAQLNMLLGQKINWAPGWVARARRTDA
jgi:hypothetical protein